MVPDAITPSNLRRALVVKLRHHGDVLLSAPVFSTLNRIAPHCEIDALVYGETVPMLEGHPAITQIHHIDRNWKHAGMGEQISAEWRLLKTLRERRYDLLVHLTEHRRGAWLARLLGPRWSVAPRQDGKFWRKSFTHFSPWASNPRRHTVETNLDALRRIGIQPIDEDKRVTLVPGAAAEARVAELLGQHGLGDREFIHLHPASRWLFKCWPAVKVAQLADALAARGVAIVLTAAPEPKEISLIGEVLAAVHAPVVDLAGRLSLKELAALAARARLFVGVDSAPMHIAAAMDTPTVALFGPSGDIEWGPWRTAHRVIASDAHPCRPCGQDGCGGGKVSECLTTLPVERVLAACTELL
ncbi:MAG: putative lipopolysaccharide heptosyltransferase III [Gammaproteobacteria bacterium]|nr:putative lipopolysaccharide heptosyltransferase III [Gammaproteobacteria bacterium]MBU1416015.1 putative lipopolysaccharide heptosyltransferase III [Gammaproteobacteria bacterium]